MKEIKKILICGLGGLGCICATSIQNSSSGILKVLLDKERYKKYQNNPTIFNNNEYYFEYILPDEKNFKADLIIIATKNNGFYKVIEDIKNFITRDTIIISLLNGINSENIIKKELNFSNVITSFYIGHSCIRNNRNIYQDGIYEIVIGTSDIKQNDILYKLSDFFNKSQIKYRISKSINEEYWKKFMINVGINQLCAVTGLTLKQLKKDTYYKKKLKDLMKEVELIATKEGIKNTKKIYNEAVAFLLEELEDANPSMLQDIEAGRKTEVEIFSGEIIRLGKKHNILTPFNEAIYNEIKHIEERTN